MKALLNVTLFEREWHMGGEENITLFLLTLTSNSGPLVGAVTEEYCPPKPPGGVMVPSTEVCLPTWFMFGVFVFPCLYP